MTLHIIKEQECPVCGLGINVALNAGSSDAAPSGESFGICGECLVPLTLADGRFRTVNQKEWEQRRRQFEQMQWSGMLQRSLRDA